MHRSVPYFAIFVSMSRAALVFETRAATRSIAPSVSRDPLGALMLGR
jgi:hypothetical protein